MAADRTHNDSVTVAANRVSLQAAAARLGVHYQTVYRWVRQGVLPAVKVGGSYEVEPAAISALVVARTNPTPPPVRRVRDWPPLSDRLHRCLIAGDEATAGDLIGGLAADGLPLAEICDRAIVPALVRIGEQWHDGEISIADEHRASGICERAIGRWPTTRPGRPRGVAVVCSPPSDEHAIPGEMATVVLRADHWRVHHLGVGVPVADIVALAKFEAADLVVVSVTWLPALPEVDEIVAGLGGSGAGGGAGGGSGSPGGPGGPGGPSVLVGRPGLTMADLVDAIRASPKRRA